MGTFELLSPNIQKKIWEMGWESFTPVQDAAIPVIMNTDKDVVISSGTASGKTEAAFLPILSKIEQEGIHKLKVIYISPLKALINNQFERIIRLCERMDIPIHRWHGDVSASRKKEFTKNPSGILLITPESIESLFINRTSHLSHIFKDVDFVVIDEIHSFIGSERGVQLRSLLSRIGEYTITRPRIIGLSATISNFEQVKRWINFECPNKVEIIQSKGYEKKLLYSLMYFEMDKSGKKPIELFRDIRALTRDMKAIIFCNSRSDVEELTYFLNRMSQRENIGDCYFAYHSSIDKSGREYIEKIMMESKTPKSVVATSALELGIDIGDVDIVIQLDNTFTVSSLKQRLGRSGRKKGSSQILQLYATCEDSLLQSLAVMELNLDGWVEPASEYGKPYDIAFHQIISLCAEYNGLKLEQIMEKLFSCSVFQTLDRKKVHELIIYMIEKDILEFIRGTGEIIVGLRGEKILRSKDFYAVFMTAEEYTVLKGAKKIGMLDKNSIINVGDNIILAGKLWTIKDIDDNRNRVYVSEAVDGKPPRYTGGGINIHPRIGEKMMEILCTDISFNYIDEKAKNVLDDMRRKYHYEALTVDERPIWIMKDKIIFEPFTGTVISKTLCWMLRAIGLNATVVDGLGRIEVEHTSDFEWKFKQIYREWSVDDILQVTKQNEWFVSKYSSYLPKDMLLDMHTAHELDIDGTMAYLKEKRFRFLL